MSSLNLRVIHTHDTAENWDKCTTFIPMAGELIVYDVDEDFPYERFKIGDGTHSINELEFTTDAIVKALFNVSTNNVIKLDGGNITSYTPTE